MDYTGFRRYLLVVRKVDSQSINESSILSSVTDYYYEIRTAKRPSSILEGGRVLFDLNH
jgi:hypothetical protein